MIANRSQAPVRRHRAEPSSARGALSLNHFSPRALGRRCRPTVLKCLCCLLVLAALAPKDEAAEQPKPRVVTTYSAWLKSVSLLATEEEVRLFESLTEDLERERFVEVFWDRRGKDNRHRFFHNQWAAQEARYRSPEMEWVASLTGQPDSTVTLNACGPVRRRLQLWTFTAWQVARQSGDQDSEGGTLAFVQDSRLDPRTYRLWSPQNQEDLAIFSTSSPEEPSLELLEKALEAARKGNCLEDNSTPRAAKRWAKGLAEALDRPNIRARFGWADPSGELPEEFSRQPFGVASLAVQPIGRFFRKTILHGRITLPTEVLKTLDGRFLFDRVRVRGDLLHNKRLVDSFEAIHHIAGEAPVVGQVALDFYRRLLPATYEIHLRVVDGQGQVLLRDTRPVEVPAMEADAPVPPGRRGDFNSLTRTDTISLQTFPSVRLLPLPSESLPGTLRLRSVTSGGPIAAVEFRQAGQTFARDEEAPYLAELETSAPREWVEVVAVDSEGRPLARDEKLLRTRGRPFRIQLEAPEEAARTLAVTAGIPAGELMVELRCWLNHRQTATVSAPPWSCPVPGPPYAAPTFARAVGRLASGEEAEDVVFLSETPSERVAVEVAEVLVSVLGKQGRPVTGLEAEDFRLLENHQERSILRVESVENLPLDVAVLMDTSSSMGTRVSVASKSAQTFFESLLEEGDHASLVSFNQDLHQRVPFTADTEFLRIGALGVRAYGTTRLWDAVVYGVSSFAGRGDRRAMVVLTDGSDTDSDFAFEQVLEASLRARVILFPIALGTLDEATARQLETLARETGGRSFQVKAISQLGGIYRQIEETLRTQYLIEYRPQEDDLTQVPVLEVKLTQPELEAHSLRRRHRAH
ncbi:MAG: VWA domain-containing protein [Deltaproteobacteria bacterium]|nr:VWA domain-containing protein [Deltaproteobacteria bacterium]